MAAQGRAPKLAAEISFADFIDVIGAQASRDQDPHWRRQVAHLGLPEMQYDALIHLELLGESWKQIGELIRVPDVQEEFFCRNSTHARAHLTEHYTPELLARVAEIYAGDYSAFGYPVPSQ